MVGRSVGQRKPGQIVKIGEVLPDETRDHLHLAQIERLGERALRVDPRRARAHMRVKGVSLVRRDVEKRIALHIDRKRMRVEPALAEQAKELALRGDIVLLGRERAEEGQISFDVFRTELSVLDDEMAYGRKAERRRVLVVGEIPIGAARAIAEESQPRLFDIHLGQEDTPAEQLFQIERERQPLNIGEWAGGADLVADPIGLGDHQAAHVGARRPGKQRDLEVAGDRHLALEAAGKIATHRSPQGIPIESGEHDDNDRHQTGEYAPGPFERAVPRSPWRV